MGDVTRESVAAKLAAGEVVLVGLMENVARRDIRMNPNVQQYTRDHLLSKLARVLPTDGTYTVRHEWREEWLDFNGDPLFNEEPQKRYTWRVRLTADVWR